MEPDEEEQLGQYEQAQRARLAQDTPARPVTTPTLPKAPAPPQPVAPPPEVDQGVRRALAATAEDSGDEGTVNRLATLTGMAPEVLRALEPATIQQMAREQGVLANTQDTPVLRGRFADPDFARGAAGDVLSLAEIERQMLAMRQVELQREAAKPKPAAPTAPPATPQGDGFARMYGGAGDAMREALPNVPNALASGMARLSSGIYGIPRALSETNDQFASWVAGRPIESGVSQFFQDRQEAAQGYAQEWMPKVDDPTMQAALGGIASLPSSGAGLVLALLSGGSAAPFVGAGFAGGVTAGDEYGTARSQGMDPLSSATYGLGQGTVETVTEMLPMKWLIGDITSQTPFVKMFLRNLAAEGMTEQAATLGQDFLAWAYLPENADKPFQSYLDERLPAGYETLVATMVASGIQTGVIGVATEIQKNSQQDTERSETGLDALDAMVKAAADSKLRDANAEQFEQYVESLAQDAPIRAAYMSPEAFAAAAAAEGVTPQQLAEEFGVEGQVDASLATGAPLEIPLGRFVSRVSGRDNRDAFMNGVSWSAFTYSRDQLKVIPEGMRDRLMAEADQLAQAAAEDEALNAQVETIRSGIEAQLNATGRFVGDPNRVYSRVASIYYANLARRMGKTPEEVFAQYPLKVAGERIVSGSKAATRGEAFVEQEGRRDPTEIDEATIATAQETLTPRQFEAWSRAVKGMSNAEVAADMGVSRVAAQLAISRARQAGFPVATATSEKSDQAKARMAGRIAATQEDAFEYFDSVQDADKLPLSAIVEDLDVTARQAEQLRKKWRAERAKFDQLDFEPMANMAAQDLVALPEDQWNDAIKATKYAAYVLPEGVASATLPKGYVVVLTRDAAYAVREDHLRARQAAGANVTRVYQEGEQAEDGNTAVFNGKRFWSGSFDTLDGTVLEVHSRERAEAEDFHHSFYFSPTALEAMREGSQAFFWVDYDGRIMTEWRAAKAAPGIIDKIRQQIEILPTGQSRLRQDAGNRPTLWRGVRGPVRDGRTFWTSDKDAATDYLLRGDGTLGELVSTADYPADPFVLKDDADAATLAGWLGAKWQASDPYWDLADHPDLPAVLRARGYDGMEFPDGTGGRNHDTVLKLESDPLGQEKGKSPRGEYYPSTATINLLRRADLSTFIHELGHHFLELQTGIAFDLQNRLREGGELTVGEQEILDDTLLWLRSVGLKPPTGMGRPDESMAQDDMWVLRFFENYEPNANDETIAAALRKLADDRKPPVLKVFKTSKGRIITFPADQYNHSEARSILELYKVPDADLKMEHGEIRFGQTLRDIHWYDRTGTLADPFSYEQNETSFRAAAKSTPVERALWFDDNVYVGATPGGGRTLEIRSRPDLKKPDIIVSLTPSLREDGKYNGFIVDLGFRGATFRDADAKNSPERSKQAHVMLVKAALALRAYTERTLPDYYSFVGADPGLDRIYDIMLRGYDFGYEARTDEFYDYDSNAGDKPVLRRSFMLVRPDLASELPVELYNAQVLADGPRRIKQYARTDIVRPGDKNILGNSVNPDGVGGGATGAEPLYQGGSRQREAIPIEDITLLRASEMLTDEQFEAFKMARTGMSNEDIAANMDETGETTPQQVAQFLMRARRKGFIVPKAKQGSVLGADTLRIIALSGAGHGPAAIYDKFGVYSDRPRAEALGQIRVLRNRHKAAIEKYKASRDGKLEQGEIFFSALKRAVENSKQGKAPAAQWKATLKQTPGVKAEEIEWSGIENWLDAQEGAVTREAVLSFLDANGVRVEEKTFNRAAFEAQVQARAQELEDNYARDFYGNNSLDSPFGVSQLVDEDGEPTESWTVIDENGDTNEETYDSEEAAQEAADDLNREWEHEQFIQSRDSQNFELAAANELSDNDGLSYESFTLPGGEDYTEILLTLPGIKGPATHWDEPNVVAHVRFKTRRGASFPYAQKVEIMERVRKAAGVARVDQLGPNWLGPALANGVITQAEADGLSPKRVLAIEEIQSDWHQKGRDQGYRTPVSPEALARAERTLEVAKAERAAAQQAVRDTQQTVAKLLASEPYAAILREIDKPKDGVAPILQMHDNVADIANKEPFQPVGSFLDQASRGVGQHAMFKKLTLDQQEALQDAEANMLAAASEAEGAYLSEREAGIARDMARNPVGIPRAPFANNGWAALVLKRMVRYAADNGYDSVAWTPGEVKNGDYVPNGSATRLRLDSSGGFSLRGPSGEWEQHSLYTAGEPGPREMTLDNVLGKQVAAQLRAAEPGADGIREISGEFVVHYQPGWEFYDLILRNEANKLGKKYGAQVSSSALLVQPTGSRRSAPAESLQFPSLPITPELKAAALEGMPLFQPMEGPKLSPAEERMFNERMRRKPNDPVINAEERAFFREAMRGLPEDGNELDIWNSMTLGQKKFYHEVFARQTEQYFMRGDAPVPSLQRMFNKVRSWLTTVYQSLADLNVEMSDEVKGVFDRMFAASQDIAEAQRENVLSPLFTVRPDHMTEPEWQEYQALNAQAVDDAEATLSQRSLRDVKWLGNARSRELKRLQAEASEQRKAMRAQVTSEVMAEPVNVARRFLSRGEQEDGTPVAPELTLLDPEGNLVKGKPKLSIAGLEAMYPEGSGVDWKALGFGKWGLVSKDGLHPDALAPMLGYESGDQLVRELLAAEDAQEKITGVTDQRMLERYGDLTDEKAIARAADEAVYSGLRGRVLAAEYAALTAALGKRSLLNEAAQAAASKLVGRMPHRKLSPARFMAAERQAGKRAEQALRKNDLAGAAAAKKDQILSFYMTREVMAKQKERDKAMGQFQKILRAKKDSVSKSRNFDLVQAARAVLASYGMAQMQNKPREYLKAIQKYDPVLYSSLEPTLDGALSSGMTLKDLSVDQFMGVRDVVQQLWDLAREEMLVEINGQKVDLAAVTGELTQRMEDLGADPNRPVTETPSEGARKLRIGESFAAALRRVESWTRLQDGDKPGPFTKFLWRPVSQAATRYRADMSVRMRQFRDLFKAIEPTLYKAKIHSPELGYTFRGKADLLHAILHTGNDSNKRKLLLGYRWATEDVNGNLDTARWDTFMARMAREGVVTVADYQFAQGVWDMLEEIKPLAQAAHRRVFGRYFSEITANPVQTPFGEFRGGYVPAISDDYFNTDMALKRAQETLEGHDSSMFPAPAKGFTEARVEYNQPLQLDLRILGSHIDKVLRFAHMAAPTRDVLRILRSKGVERNMHDLHPAAMEGLLLPWLNRAAKQTNEFPLGGKAGHGVTAFSNGLRSRANMGIMFANLVNVLQQPTGLFNAAAYKGFKKRELANALVRFLRDPAGTHRAIRALSQVIATRADSQAIAMRDEVQSIAEARGPMEKATAWFARHTYFAQIALQNQQDAIVWLAALESAKSKGETEADAVQFADAVVRQTQGSAVPEDISRFETGTGWHKVLVSMYGYFNMWGNQLSTEFRSAARDLGLAKGKGRMIYVYMVGFMAPAVLAQFIADALRGDLPDDEDEEEEPLLAWLEWFFGAQAKGATAMVPLVGSVGMAGVNAFNEKPYDDRVMSSPAISVLEAAARTPANIYDFTIGEGDGSRTFKDAMTLLTLMTGVPFQALNRPVGYAIDVLEGDVTPEDGVDAARGAIAGR